MKILVCGGRAYQDGKKVAEVLDKIDVTHIIEGGARGADNLARQWALNKGILITTHPAQWKHYGKSAGARRNLEMLQEKPDLVVAFPGGRGTAHMISIARQAGVGVRMIDSEETESGKDEGGRLWAE